MPARGFEVFEPNKYYLSHRVEPRSWELMAEQPFSLRKNKSLPKDNPETSRLTPDYHKGALIKTKNGEFPLSDLPQQVGTFRHVMHMVRHSATFAIICWLLAWAIFLSIAFWTAEIFFLPPREVVSSDTSPQTSCRVDEADFARSRWRVGVASQTLQ